MNEIKQASTYLRVLWLNDNENLRPDNINIKLDGEVVEETTFSISQSDNNVGNNATWEANEWVNGITYDYQKEEQEQAETNENEIPEEIHIYNNIPNVIPSVTNIPNNYRCNILKNAETEEYSYYTIKMTYVPPKRKKMVRSTAPILNFNGTTIENVKFNGVELDKVTFNGTTVFEKSTAPLFKDIILANSTLNEGTPYFSLTATTDEGMFETDDPMYGEGAKSQYFRGAVTNNYVKFANFWWRIIRINGDGTVRLIYDGTEGHINGESTSNSVAVASVKYNTSRDQSNYVGWTYEGQLQRPTDNATGTASNAKVQLESWYSNNITGTNAAKVAQGKYCNDRNVRSGDTWAISGSEFEYAAYVRRQNNSPTLSCPTGDVYTLNVGLITMDEARYAGAEGITDNSSYYLRNGKYYWTMSPYRWSGSYAYVTTISSNGYLYDTNVNWTAADLRPVINLKADVQVTGTGTIDDPYVVVGAE